MLNSCSTTNPPVFVEPQAVNNANFGLDYSTEEREVIEIQNAYYKNDYITISNKMNGYVRANNESFIYKLISADESVSIMVLSSLVARENKSSFEKVYQIANDRVLRFSSEKTIKNMKIAWDECKQEFPKAMREYLRSNAKLAPVQKYIQSCDKMEPVFNGAN